MRINGEEIPTEPIPQDAEIVGEVLSGTKDQGRSRKIARMEDIPVSQYGAASRLLWRESGRGVYVGKNNYVAVLVRNTSFLAGAGVCAAAVIVLAIWLFMSGGTSPAEESSAAEAVTSSASVSDGETAASDSTVTASSEPSVTYVGDAMEGISSESSTTEKDSAYTTFSSTPDQTWAAGATQQAMSIKNPPNNSVDISPKVYVDINHDGSYTDDECVWNDGATDPVRIAPGYEVSTITLTKALDAGTYDAKVVYSAYAEGSTQETNGIEMSFTVTVQ